MDALITNDPSASKENKNRGGDGYIRQCLKWKIKDERSPWENIIVLHTVLCLCMFVCVFLCKTEAIVNDMTKN